MRLAQFRRRLPQYGQRLPANAILLEGPFSTPVDWDAKRTAAQPAAPPPLPKLVEESRWSPEVRLLAPQVPARLCADSGSVQSYARWLDAMPLAASAAAGPKAPAALKKAASIHYEEDVDGSEVADGDEGSNTSDPEPRDPDGGDHTSAQVHGGAQPLPA